MVLAAGCWLPTRAASDCDVRVWTDVVSSCCSASEGEITHKTDRALGISPIAMPSTFNPVGGDELEHRPLKDCAVLLVGTLQLTSTKDSAFVKCKFTG